MIDEAIANTVCALDAAGLLDNTLIVVSGDK
jgi:arylsulfatase A-like enzyme